MKTKTETETATIEGTLIGPDGVNQKSTLHIHLALPPPAKAHPQLRVWHIPQVPGKRFFVPVPDLAAAHLVLAVLAQYDMFQFKHRIKGDYSNAQGLEVFVEDDWNEWDNEEGDDITSVACRDCGHSAECHLVFPSILPCDGIVSVPESEVDHPCSCKGMVFSFNS